MNDERPDRALCVFCGSSSIVGEDYMEVARRVGRYCAAENIGLVYGGARVGLMGMAADTALAHGGYVEGVIPAFLDEKEVAHSGLTRLHMTQTMHERQAKMADLSDAFLVLPGGLG